eukprot:14993927-Heterocapsa_arctica.AAC.1
MCIRDSMWAPARPTGCELCQTRGSQRIGSKSSTQLNPRGARNSLGVRLLPVTSKATLQGQRVHCLVSTGHRAHWPLPGKGWWPSPRAVPVTAATARWIHTRCTCGLYQAELVAATPLKPGEELTVADQGHALNFEDPPGTEITWDGGAKSVNGVRVAGAAAILWGPPDQFGDRTPITTAS